jgi:putative solute:sodium symporter small subunit
MIKAPDLHNPEVHAALDRYWRANMRTMFGLLLIWAGVSFGCGILLADWLNQFRLPFTGFPLGFWFAQQGSIVVFVFCILAYCLAMNRLDRRHHEELERLASSPVKSSAANDPSANS